jgi:hypothetical protein
MPYNYKLALEIPGGFIDHVVSKPEASLLAKILLPKEWRPKKLCSDGNDKPIQMLSWGLETRPEGLFAWERSACNATDDTKIIRMHYESLAADPVLAQPVTFHGERKPFREFIPQTIKFLASRRKYQGDPGNLAIFVWK